MNCFAERNDYIFNTRVFQKIEVKEGLETNVLEKAVELMKAFEKELNFYDENSMISEINKNAGKKEVKVSKNVIDIIKESLRCSYLTEGLFDITIAPLVRKWAINSSNPHVLEKRDIDETLKSVGCENVQINEEKSTVKLVKEGCCIDLGGIAKGYIADKVIELYQSFGIKRGIINLGGNVKTIGRRDKENSWQVGIIEPVKHSSENICSVSADDLSVVTSGSYERAFMMDGKMYSHILNPKSGYPCITDLKSITIIDESSLRADAFSTPLFIMGKYKAAEFMRENNISGIMVTSDDKILISKDLIGKFKLFKNYEVLSF